MKAGDMLELAIAATAKAWTEWSSTACAPANLNVRDRIALFVPTYKAQLFADLPALRTADDQVLLLILAEGVAQSGTDPRDRTEESLGISLPPEQ